MLAGRVRFGEVVSTDGTESPGSAHLDLDMLRTSLLAVGPSGAGKTRGVVLPLVEHLCLSALTHRASVVVVDTDAEFERDGWFDVTIDPLNPTHGISLFGRVAPEVAADRLASALLPAGESEDGAFADAASNALYACLAPYVDAYGRWPSVRELLGLLRGDRTLIASVRDRLEGPDANESRELLDSRERHPADGTGPVAGIVQRFARLDRPATRRLFDAEKMFDPTELNGPVRVRVVLPEVEYPEASRILFRLLAARFLSAATAGDANRDVFKALVVDGAARHLDGHLVRGAQRLRAGNAGLVVTARSLSELEPGVRAAAGNQVVLGGLDPADAEVFAHAFGDEGTPARPEDDAENDEPADRLKIGLLGVRAAKPSPKPRQPARWTAADVAGIPRGHCLLTTTRSNGFRSGPQLISL